MENMASAINKSLKNTMVADMPRKKTLMEVLQAGTATSAVSAQYF